MISPRPEKLSLSEMNPGRTYFFKTRINDTDIDRFAALSGDYNPLHMDAKFAKSRGFPGRVVHGAYLTALASQIVGMHLPGENCLLHSVQMKFAKPVCCGMLIKVTGIVDQLSEATAAAVIAISITDPASDEVFASGKAVVGIVATR